MFSFVVLCGYYYCGVDGVVCISGTEQFLNVSHMSHFSI